MLSGKVGVAPGTTTLVLGENIYARTAFEPPPIQQNPGVTVRSQTGQLMGDLGMIRPTDFEMTHIREYLPVQSGWIVGKTQIAGGDDADRTRRAAWIAAGIGAAALAGLAVWAVRRS